MPEERSFHPKEYVCPICGEKTTFGSHFCKGERAPKRNLAGPIKRSAIVLVGLLLIEAMLWDLIGLYSLYAAAAVAVLALAAVAIGRSPLARRARRGRDFRELVKLAGGDREAAERLVDLETLKHPGWGRAVAIRAALESYERDLR